jgi:uncharacterized protein
MSEKLLTLNDWQRLADCLAEDDNIVAAWIFGSAREGSIRPGADIDIGVFFARMPSIDELADLRSALQDVLAFDEIDLVVLNEASPILRFEAISGRPVYTADRESRATFVSLTAREYEDEMAQWQRALIQGR